MCLTQIKHAQIKIQLLSFWTVQFLPQTFIIRLLETIPSSHPHSHPPQKKKEGLKTKVARVLIHCLNAKILNLLTIGKNTRDC